MEPKGFRASNECSREQALLLENLRSNENAVFEDVARRALEAGSSNGTDVNFVYPPPLNKTLLDIACSEGRDDFVEILVGIGASVDGINDAHRRGPLHFAAEAGHDGAIKILLENGKANPNLEAAGGQTALHMAVRRENGECVRVLLENGGADPNIVNSKGLTPIHVAAMTGQREMVRLILNSSKFPVDIDGFRDFRKLTTRDVLQQKIPDLELPPRDDNREIIARRDNLARSRLNENDESRFLEKLKSINDDDDDDDDNDDGAEELMKIAARQNFAEAARELMTKRAGPDVPRFGEAAARIAVELGHYDVLREILTIDSKLANELLLVACRELGVATSARLNSAEDRAKCLQLIMQQPNVNVRCEDDKGNTPLHYAARAEAAELVGTLLRSGSYIGHRNALGTPPLAHISPGTLSDFFDDCLRSKNERTDDYKIEFDYRCLMPHNAVTDVSGPRDHEEFPAREQFQLSVSNDPSYETATSEMETLAFIAENRALQPLLKHPLLSSFLYLKWRRMRYILYGNFIFYVTFYVLINFHIVSTNYLAGNDTNDDERAASGITNTTGTRLVTSFREVHALKTLALIALVTLAARESLQFLSSPRNYVTSVENILELSLIVLAGWVLVSPNPRIGAVVILLSAWELVMLIGQHPRMSTGIEMFKTVSVNFAHFLFLYAFLILAFALAFFTLFNNSKDDVNFPDPVHSLFKTIIMLTGEFDANNIPFVSSPVLSHCIFVLFVFLIAIVLFNLLNGLAVSDTAQILNKSELVGLVSRTRLVSYAESVAVASGLVKFARHCGCSERSFRRSSLNPLRFFTRTILLFPNYLPQGKIGVKPYGANEIRYHGRAQRTKNCMGRCSMDPWIVECARKVLSRRGEMTENDRLMTEFDTIKRKLERLETLMDEMRLALANNNNVNSSTR